MHLTQRMTNFFEKFRNRIMRANQIAMENQWLAQVGMKEHYDKNAVKWEFEIGD